MDVTGVETVESVESLKTIVNRTLCHEGEV